MPIHRLAVLALLVFALPLSAQSPFEAVVAGRRLICFPEAPPQGGVVAWVNPNRTDFTPQNTTEVTAVASADGVRVLGTQNLPIGSIRVVELRPDGTVIPVSAPVVAYAPAAAIAIAPDGRIFVMSSPVPSTVVELLVFSPAGVLQTSYPLPPSATSLLEFGTDNCTLFYGAGDVLRRFNVCTGTPLPDFVTAPDIILDAVVLPDGRVLIASADDQVQLYGPDGTLLRNVITSLAPYAVSSGSIIAEIELSADQQVLYLVVPAGCFSSNTDFLRVNFNTGALISRTTLPMNTANALVLGSSHGTNVPTLGEWMLLLLAMMLAAAGVWLIRT